MRIEPQQVLPNGATVIAVKGLRPDEHYKAVLAHFGGEYVTWLVSEEDGSAFWGHYFNQDFGRAAADLAERASRG